MAPTGSDNRKESLGPKRKKTNETVERNGSPTKKPKIGINALSAYVSRKVETDINVNMSLAPSSPLRQHTLHPNGQDPSTPSTSTQHKTSTTTELSPWSILSNKSHVGSAVSGREEGIVNRLKDWSESNVDLSIHVGLELENGEYVLKLRNIPTSTEMERAEVLAKSAAMLLLQGEMLRSMGEHMLAQFQASFQSILIKKSAPPSTLTDEVE